jgi:hypothetical protein
MRPDKLIANRAISASVPVVEGAIGTGRDPVVPRSTVKSETGKGPTTTHNFDYLHIFNIGAVMSKKSNGMRFLRAISSS